MADSCSLTRDCLSACAPKQQLLPECVHTKLHVNPHELENTSACTPGRADAPATGAHTCTHTHTPFISPSSRSPVPSVEQRPILSFPPWQHEQDVPITCVLTPPPLGQAPRSIWKHLPDVNSEWGPESKRCKRLRRGRWICIHSEGMIVTPYAVSLCREKTLLLSPFCFPHEPFISPSF